jgi:hypothetical protein
VGCDVMKRRYVTADVFTKEMFGGNPVAVVLDAEGLSTAQMQAIALELITAKRRSCCRQVTQPTLRTSESSRLELKFPSRDIRTSELRFYSRAKERPRAIERQMRLCLRRLLDLCR